MEAHIYHVDTIKSHELTQVVGCNVEFIDGIPFFLGNQKMTPILVGDDIILIGNTLTLVREGETVNVKKRTEDDKGRHVQLYDRKESGREKRL